jgi:hypothetical protein
MTREETKELLMMIRAIYPNFNVKPAEMPPTINAWYLMLEEYPAESVKAALKIYIKTNGSGFAPSVSQLIDSMYAPKQNENLSEGEAWALVKKSITDGNYHSQERFDELPPIVQKAVGNAEMIRYWAGCDSSEVNTVIMSNFQRSYKALLEKQSFYEKVPAETIQQISGSLTPGIGVADES